MKRTSILVLVVLALGGSVIASAIFLLTRGESRPGGSLSVPNSPKTSSTTIAVGVDQLMNHTEKYPGEVIVEGIVSASAPGRVSLIDVGEVEECGVTTCAELVLPVEWSGNPPKGKQRVKLLGSVRETGEGMVFVARSMEAAPPNTVGAASAEVDTK